MHPLPDVEPAQPAPADDHWWQSHHFWAGAILGAAFVAGAVLGLVTVATGFGAG